MAEEEEEEEEVEVLFMLLHRLQVPLLRPPPLAPHRLLRYRRPLR